MRNDSETGCAGTPWNVMVWLFYNLVCFVCLLNIISLNINGAYIYIYIYILVCYIMCISMCVCMYMYIYIYIYI